MASNANADRPAIYKVTRGSILKGKRVTTPYATPEDLQAIEGAKPAARQVAVREVETGT